MTAHGLPARRATIRTYRHGLGDCHLLTVFGAANTKFTIMIDCGVILGTPGAKDRMTTVMEDIITQTNGRVDLLVVTHEHWDHVSGFLQARDAFARLQVGDVWMAWTENPDDDDAKLLRKERGAALQKLQMAATRMRIDGQKDDSFLTSLLEFFGAAAGNTTKDALEAARAKSATPRYCDPAGAPFNLPNGFGARIFTLGPPREVALLKKTLPSRKSPETYGIAESAFDATVATALVDAEAEDAQPFSSSSRIPTEIARSMPFFQQHYWSDASWRRIDLDWMDDANQFALALDSMTNNTSLVLALQLQDVGVLLFAADAQVGNWLSWPDCAWNVSGEKITGAGLLDQTIYYKVGHHGSHNATLKAQGLELMRQLKIAVIPVDHEMAVKKKWGNIPLTELEDELRRMTNQGGLLLRTDQDPPASPLVDSSNPLYFDVHIDKE